MNRLILAITALAVVGCHSSESKQPASTDSAIVTKTDSTKTATYLEQKIDTCAIGDINKDGITDSAFIHTPAIKASDDVSDFGCANDSCFVTITFSNRLPDLIHGNAIHGLVFSTADINEDGIAEIIYAPDWFSSCWSGFFIYSLSGNQWKKIGDGSYYSCNENAGLAKRVKKIRKNCFTVLNDEMNDDGVMKKKAQTIIVE